jgi:hypothetical protein
LLIGWYCSVMVHSCWSELLFVSRTPPPPHTHLLDSLRQLVLAFFFPWRTEDNRS